MRSTPFRQIFAARRAVRRARAAIAAVWLGLAALLLPGAALASICHAFVEGIPGVRVATLGPFAEAPAGPISITYVGHSTYRIESPGGVVVATDYFGTHGEGRLPDIVTMNKAHETHYTDFPDPAIPHVLRGWNPAGTEPASHLIEVRDLVARNVTTDIRGWGVPEADANSIFVFEVGELCIGHLGHLHHTLDEQHYAQLGQLDIVMAPVDGLYTLDLAGMIEVLKRLKARIVLPMHAFGPSSLRTFLDGMDEEFEIGRIGAPTLTVTADKMPDKPTILLPSNIAFGLLE